MNDSEQPKWLQLATADQETEFYLHEGAIENDVHSYDIDVQVPSDAVVDFSRRMRFEITEGIKDNAPSDKELLALLRSPWWYLATKAMPKPRFSPFPHIWHLRRGPLSSERLIELQEHTADGFSYTQMMRLAYLRNTPLPKAVLSHHRTMCKEDPVYARRRMKKRSEAPTLHECSESFGHLRAYKRPHDLDPFLPLRHQISDSAYYELRERRLEKQFAPDSRIKERVEELVHSEGRITPELLIPAIIFTHRDGISDILKSWTGDVIGRLKTDGSSYLQALGRALIAAKDGGYKKGHFSSLTPVEILNLMVEFDYSQIGLLEDYAHKYRGRDRLKRRILVSPARADELIPKLRKTHSK